MIKLTVLTHGQRIRSAYAPLPGKTEGAWGTSTDKDRPAGQISGIVQRYKKHDEATYNSHALGWIKATYANAIEYTSMTKELRGYAFWLGIFGGVIGIIGIIGALFAASLFITAPGWWPRAIASKP